MSSILDYYRAVRRLRQSKITADNPDPVHSVPQPDGCCTTLWVPYSSHKHMAGINLNYALKGFDSCNRLIGYDCITDTHFIVFHVPLNFTEIDMWCLAEIVAKKFPKGANLPALRSLATRNKTKFIEDAIMKFFVREYVGSSNSDPSAAKQLTIL